MSTNPLNQGKTFADVFDSIISDVKKFVGFILLIFCFVVLIYFVIWIITKTFDLSGAKEIQVSATGTRILFETKSGDKTESLLIVHPQGWQDSGIKVKKDDRIKFESGGSITIDLHGIVERTEIRRELEDRYGKKKNLDRTSVTVDQTPEYYYTDEDKQSLRLERGWIGSEGYPNTLTSRGYAGNRQRRLVPDKPPGSLIGAIKNSLSPTPERPEAFCIGRSYETTVSHDGTLWFNVNDTLNDEDPQNADLFYADNIGFFWVKVTVER